MRSEKPRNRETNKGPKPRPHRFNRGNPGDSRPECTEFCQETTLFMNWLQGSRS